MKNHLKLVSIWLLMLVVVGCENHVSSIPDMNVYFKRNINTEKIAMPGTYLYVTTARGIDQIGFGGLLIYHAFNNEYYAVDLACPHEVNPNVRISPPDDLGHCKCDSCGEVYNLSSGDGFPLKGISKEPLKSYNVSIDEYEFITIYR